MLPILFQGYLLGNESAQKLELLYNKSISKNMDSLSINLDLYINHIEDNLRAFSQDAELLELLNTREEQKNKISTKLDSFSTVYRIRVPLDVVVISRYGEVFSNSPIYETEALRLKKTVQSFPWYADNLGYDKKVIYHEVSNDFHDHLTRNNAVYIVKNLVYGNEHLGLMVLQMNQTLIQRLIYQIQLSPETVAFISSPNKEILIPNEGKEVETALAQEVVSRCMEAGTDYAGFHFPWKGKEYFSSCHYISYLSWYLVAVIPKEMVVTESREVWLYTFIVTGASIFLISFILLLLAQKVMIPILKLARLVRQYRINDLSGRYEYQGVEEIEILSSGINQMLERMQIQVQKIKEDEKQKLELELNLLQSQIRPHFLHNAINSVRWMAEIKGEKSIAHALVNLASMLHYTLNNYQVIWSTVADEMAYVKSYIAFQEARMIIPIETEIRLDPDTRDVAIPKLSLQPFVENSIQHGFTSLEKRKPKLGITCVKIGKEVIITIEDNGIGMSPEMIPQILDISGHKKAGEANSGIGIKNVIRRLQLKFGGTFHIHAESKPDAGSKFIIIIPDIHNDEGERE